MRILVGLAVAAFVVAGCGSGPAGATVPSGTGFAGGSPAASATTPGPTVGPRSPAGASASAAPTSRESAAPSLPASTPLGDRLLATIGGLAHPCAMAADASSVWVTDQSPDELVRIDPTSNTITAHFPIEGSPCGLAVGPKGRLWVARYAIGSVTAVDPVRGATTAAVGGFGQIWDLKFGFGSVWITDRGGPALVRIDPATAKVVARISVGTVPSGIAIAAGSVWVGDDATSAIARVDPVTNAVTATIRVDHPLAWLSDSGDLVIGADRVLGNVVGIDVGRNAAGAVIGGFDQPLDGTIAAGRAWIPDGRRRTLTELDPATLGVIRVDDLAGTKMPFVVESAFGSIWVLDFGGTSVLRIRP
jgi:streptogramin lyase